MEWNATLILYGAFAFAFDTKRTLNFTVASSVVPAVLWQCLARNISLTLPALIPLPDRESRLEFLCQISDARAWYASRHERLAARGFLVRGQQRLLLT